MRPGRPAAGGAGEKRLVFLNRMYVLIFVSRQRDRRRRRVHGISHREGSTALKTTEVREVFPKTKAVLFCLQFFSSQKQQWQDGGKQCQTLRRDGPNLYLTLHCHKVDDSTLASDGHVSHQPLPVPAGWQIADGNADDIRVCGAHPWQSYYLVFANGSGCGTAMCRRPSDIGMKHRQKTTNFSSRLKIGQKDGRKDLLARDY
jgi:hypothetical protein